MVSKRRSGSKFVELVEGYLFQYVQQREEGAVAHVLTEWAPLRSRPEGSPDYLILTNRSIWLFEIKHYRTDLAQVDLLRTAAQRIAGVSPFFADDRDVSLSYQGRRVVRFVVVSSVLTPNQRKRLENEFPAVVFIDRMDLAITASKMGGNWPALDIYLQTDTVVEGVDLNVLGRTIDERVEESVLRNEAVLPPKFAPAFAFGKGRDLCAEMQQIACGRDPFKDYEDICEKVIEYLFGDQLHSVSRQKVTVDGLSRFDYVGRANKSSAFWDFIVGEVGSRYVIFECKNYCSAITQSQILTTEKYLVAPAMRMFAIIFTRKGAAKSAYQTTLGAIRENGKLMLILNDEQVCMMLDMKDRGEDPSDYLFDQCDRIFMTLSR